MAISFKGAYFPPEVILMGVRWYMAYPSNVHFIQDCQKCVLVSETVRCRNKFLSNTDLKSRVPGVWNQVAPQLTVVTSTIA